jgi:hypothetical protein
MTCCDISAHTGAYTVYLVCRYGPTAADAARLQAIDAQLQQLGSIAAATTTTSTTADTTAATATAAIEGCANASAVAAGVASGLFEYELEELVEQGVVPGEAVLRQASHS